MRFFIDEQLQELDMQGIKVHGWDFIVKAIEYLDTQLGVDYISIPQPLLRKIIQQSRPFRGAAQKFMISRLLKVRQLSH